MRVCSRPDNGSGQLDHLPRHHTMAIQGQDDRNVRAQLLAEDVDEVTIDVGNRRARHGPVRGKTNPVQAARFFHAPAKNTLEKSHGLVGQLTCYPRLCAQQRNDFDPAVPT